MLIFKRIITVCFCLAIGVIVYFFLICAAIGIVVGLVNHGDSDSARFIAERFANKNINYIFFSTFILALTTSSWLTFAGVFPWCKKRIKQ